MIPDDLPTDVEIAQETVDGVVGARLEDMEGDLGLGLVAGGFSNLRGCRNRMLLRMLV